MPTGSTDCTLSRVSKLTTGRVEVTVIPIVRDRVAGTG